MPTLLTVTGRDVLFAHWPLEPDRLAAVVPDGLAVDTFDGSAWVSALALENASVTPGSMRVPGGFGRAFPQLNVRTYVTLDGEPGVYFLSLDSGRRAPAAAGRRAFGLPFRHARMRMDRRGERITFRSYRAGDDPPPAVYQVRYEPAGTPSPPDPGSLAEFCVAHDRYYLPASEDGRADPLRSLDVDRGATFGGDRSGGSSTDSGGNDGGDRDGHASDDRRTIYVGRIERDRWQLSPATARIRRNTLFEAAGLPEPAADPVFHYSPGFEMGVEPLEFRRREGPSTTNGSGHR